ncbi:MAG: DUF1385 domain-containing protein [Synergistaceae bacterium]|nr:DUF1385 domain-containing protein [Synergistaceae bacterium]
MVNQMLFKILTLAANLSALNAEPEAEEGKRIPVGGQAVIEGVLMKGEHRWGLAVRRPGGDIFREHWPNSSRTKRLPWKLPLLRGVVVMCEMMATGFKALSRSAEVALEESQEEMTVKDIAIAAAVAVFAVGGLFIALPLWLSGVCAGLWGLSPLWTNVLEGLIRAAVFVGYIGVIGLWGDIKQVFRYHGAEHKTINAFEGGLEMTPENILTCSRIHPRCGTSFLLIAVIVSIAVFSPVKTVILSAGGGFWAQVGARVLLIPLVIGISYEIIKLASKGLIGRVLISPLLSLQYLTTREPDRGQAEIALASLNIALNKED